MGAPSSPLGGSEATVLEIETQVLVVGGGLGGVAAALAVAEHGTKVILTEEYEWLGGQLTSQATPLDEHPWVEDFGVTARYRRLRDGIREHHRRHFPLTERARELPHLNPGAGWVSKLCHTPIVGVKVIDDMLSPHVESGVLTILKPVRPVDAEMDGDRVVSVTVEGVSSGERTRIRADYVLEATEIGDLLPLTGTEYAVGFESRAEFGEPSAPVDAQPANLQAMSWCFAMDHLEGEDHTIAKPAMYEEFLAVHPPFWGDRLMSWTFPDPRTLEPVTRVFVPNPGDDVYGVEADQSKNPGNGNLWTYRRIVAKDMLEPGTVDSDVTLVNWPQIDYFLHPIVDSDDPARYLEESRQLSLSFLYWMQTEAPRTDGGKGFPGLRLRPDLMGTDDGLAMAPYHREGRRIKALDTVVEQDVSMTSTGGRARHFDNSVGIGMYRLDLHPSTGGDNYLDVPSCPFQLPLGYLIPRRVTNLLAAGKSAGTTHITNGCYRLHPIEWNTGESAGLLAVFCLAKGLTPAEVHQSSPLTNEFQALLKDDGIELEWPDTVSGY